MILMVLWALLGVGILGLGMLGIGLITSAGWRGWPLSLGALLCFVLIVFGGVLFLAALATFITPEVTP